MVIHIVTTFLQMVSLLAYGKYVADFRIFLIRLLPRCPGNFVRSSLRTKSGNTTT